MSVTGPDGWAGPVPAGRTPQEALTRTRAAAGSHHRACGPNHRIVAVTAAWTVRWAGRFRAAQPGRPLRRGGPGRPPTAEGPRPPRPAGGNDRRGPRVRSRRNRAPAP